MDQAFKDHYYHLVNDLAPVILDLDEYDNWGQMNHAVRISEEDIEGWLNRFCHIHSALLRHTAAR